MRIITSLIFVLTALNLAAQTTLVRNPEQLRKAVAAAKPGEIIQLQNGVWNDVLLTVDGNGSQEKPIIIQPETSGGVILKGNSNLRIAGEHIIVQDLHFKDGSSPKGPVIDFRTSNDNLANNCRLTGIVIENYSQPDRLVNDNWVVLWGKENRVDHCTFVDKKNAGPTLIVELNDERSQENFHQIDSNYFKGRSRLGSNGGETIRIGVSRYSLKSSRTTITANYFERCNGEAEIVSIKSGDNVISFNTFYESEGSLVLRHGNNNKVEGNLFIGNNKPFTGGIRIINAGHEVFNNVLKDLKGDRFRSALAVMNGVPNSMINRYHQVNDVNIHHNTFIHSDHIEFGIGKDAERTANPVGVSFHQNLVVSNIQNFYVDHNADGGIHFSKNGALVRSKQLPNGFVSSKAAKINVKGVSLYQADGKVGAPISALPLINADEVGAAWWKGNQTKRNHPAKRIEFSKKHIQRAEQLINDASAGDTLVLVDPGMYEFRNELIINKPLTIIADKGLKERPTFVNVTSGTLNSFIVIENGGSLSIKGVAFSGAYKSYGNVRFGIATTTGPMNKAYTLSIDDCVFHDYNESSFSGFKAAKGTYADSISIKNSVFRNISGAAIDLASEKDDKGIYNAENILIENCFFKDVLGSAINVYRGGNDESTTGPFVYLNQCTFYRVENREQGVVVKLIGVQHAKVLNSNFMNSGQGGSIIRFNEFSWDNLEVDYLNSFQSGRIESFYGKVKGDHIYQLPPDSLFNKSSSGGPLGAQLEIFPSEILDLANWKITLPISTLKEGIPDEYQGAALMSFKNEDYFYTNINNPSVVFRAFAGGITTKGSGYPRSELREMSANGTMPASWSSSKGKHTLFIDQRINQLPKAKPHIVVGQIHDADDDVIVYRLEGKKLFIDLNGKEGVVLDSNYMLGTRFTCKFVVSEDKTACYYNGELKYLYPKAFSNAFFKAGAYLQSSCKGKKQVMNEACNAVGEVEIFDLWVEHK